VCDRTFSFGLESSTDPSSFFATFSWHHNPQENKTSLHGFFAYTQQQDQYPRKHRDGYESSIRGYQLTNGAKWHQIWEKYKWEKV